VPSVLKDTDRLSQAGLLAIAAALGIVAGVDPKIAVALAIGLLFVTIVLSDLTVGLCIFTIVAFFDLLPSFGDAVFSFAKLTGLLVAVAWLAAIASRRTDRRPLSTVHPWLTAMSVAFIAWTALSLLWAELPGDGTSGLSRYALNLILLPIVFTAVTQRRHLVWVAAAFVGAASLSALFGLVQPPPATGDEPARLGGAGIEPNTFAAVLVVGFALALALSVGPRLSPLTRAMTLGGALCCALGVLLSLSRGGLIALAVALVAGVVFGGRWRPAAAVVLVLVGVLSLGYFTYVASPVARDRVTMAEGGSGRKDIWTVGLRMVRAHPLNGIGVGNFQTASVHYLLEPGAIQRADLIVDHPRVAHNTYLQVLSELGIVGLALFMGILLACLRAVLLAAHKFRDRGEWRYELLARALLVGLIGNLAADFFISNQWSKQLWLLLALCPAMLAVARRAPEDEPVPRGSRLRPSLPIRTEPSLTTAGAPR
jgi:O-antigen ligase